MAVPLQRPTPLQLDPELASEIRRLGKTLASLQQAMEEHGNRSTARSAAAMVEDFREILDGLANEAVEDGVTYPSESLVHSYLESYSHGGSSWSEILKSASSRPSVLADFLRLAGRAKSGDSAIRIQLLKAGLRSSSVEVRDAAVQAAELWADPAAVAVLAKHQEAVPWLADYLENVKREIRSASHARP
jgi:hypothetical protein